MAGLIDGWNGWKKSNPVKAGVLGVLPVTGQVTAGLDYASAMRDGNTAQAIQAAMGVVPGFKLGKYATKLAPAGLRVGMNAVERGIAPLTRRSYLIGSVNDGGDIGEAAAQTYNNAVEAQKARAVKKPQLPPLQATLSGGTV